jgi:hypothetical protein
MTKKEMIEALINDHLLDGDNWVTDVDMYIELKKLENKLKSFDKIQVKRVYDLAITNVEYIVIGAIEAMLRGE